MDIFQVKANLFACQFIYGLLSFPYLIFVVGWMVKFVTKAHPTAYDRNGRTVPVYVGELWYSKKYGRLKRMKEKLEDL